MPLQYVRGDLFASGAHILVIPVNCVGVAGKGLALQCKQRYPEWFEVYRRCCQSGGLLPGYPVLQCLSDLTASPAFLNFPTKGYWRFPSRLVDIERGLYNLAHASVPLCAPTETIAFPQLGCGAGGLSWLQVQPLMERYLSQLSCHVLIYVQ